MKMSLWRRFFQSSVIPNVYKQAITRTHLHNCRYISVNITSKEVNLIPNNITFNGVRYKSKKQYDSDDESIDDDSSLSKDSKVVKFSTTSMRTDNILKSALGVSRNKVEHMFYESKIRINGKKVLKKSVSVKEGDEVDVIKMVSPNNPDHIYVARVEILDVEPQEETIKITTRRFKHLLIENYERDPHKSISENEQ